MPPKQKTSSRTPKFNDPEQLKKLAFKKSTIIFLDVDGISEEAKMNCAISYSSKSKVLTIVAGSLNPQQKPVILEIIKKVFSGNGLIWRKDKEEILESYIGYSEINGDKATIEFFKNILPKPDFAALKMSLYLRSEKTKGNDISVYKKDIRDRFGDRGANIANLCTAGYFESEFRPLYNQVTQEQFMEYYEIAVGKKARALFVHKGMGQDEIEIEFNAMLEKAIKYHMQDFRIHGIGKQNVATIQAFFDKLPSSVEPEKFIAQKRYERSDPSASVEYIVTII